MDNEGPADRLFKGFSEGKSDGLSEGEESDHVSCPSISKSPFFLRLRSSSSLVPGSFDHFGWLSSFGMGQYFNVFGFISFLNDLLVWVVFVFHWDINLF